MLKQNLKSAKKLLCSQHYDWLQTRPINTTASCNNTFLSAEGFKPVQIVQIHRGMVTASVANCLSKTTVTDCSIATDRKQQICRIQSDATSCKPHSSDLSRHDFHLYGLLKKFLSRQFFFFHYAVVQYAMHDWFKQQSKSFFADGNRRLSKQWDASINTKGDFLKKDVHAVNLYVLHLYYISFCIFFVHILSIKTVE